MADNPSWRGVVAISGGFLVHLTIGTFYSIGNMVPYIVSYCRLRGNNPHLSPEAASWIVAAMVIGNGLTMPLGGYLERKLGVRIATFLGCFVFCLSIFLSAWAITVSFYFLLFTYGILFGVGQGLIYPAPLICAMKWLPSSKGLSNGLILSGFGLGAFVFNFVQTVIINPHNMAPDITETNGASVQVYYGQDAVLDRVPLSFVIQGVIFVVIQIIGITMLGDPPRQMKRTRRYAVRRKPRAVNEKSGILMSDKSPRTALGEEEEPSTSTASTGDVQNKPSSGITSDPPRNDSAFWMELGDYDERWSGRTLAPMAILKDVFFWQLSSAMFLDGISVIWIAGLYKAYGHTFIDDDFFLAFVGGFGAIFNSLGRVVWGLVADRFSFKVSFMTLSATLAIFMFTMPGTFYGNRPMFFIWVCGLFFSFGGIFSTAPTATSRAFGSGFVGVNYGIVFLLGISVSGFVAAGSQTVIFHRLSWNVLFVIAGAFPAFAVIVSMFMSLKTPTGVDI